MRHKLHLSALIAVFLMSAASAASAQNPAQGGLQPGQGGVPPVGTAPPAGITTPGNPGSAGISSAPGGSSTTTTGMGAGTGLNSGMSQPGAPNVSTPGTIGTGASPSGLPGDDPAHPGFPGKVGQ